MRPHHLRFIHADADLLASKIGDKIKIRVSLLKDRLWSTATIHISRDEAFSLREELNSFIYDQKRFKK